jgi:hypothetical protein
VMEGVVAVENGVRDKLNGWGVSGSVVVAIFGTEFFFFNGSKVLPKTGGFAS